MAAEEYAAELEYKYKLEGLQKVQKVNEYPEGVGVQTKATEYDKLLNNAKKHIHKLEFESEEHAKNVVNAIKTKLNSRKYKKVKNSYRVGQQGNTVYVGPKPKNED